MFRNIVEKMGVVICIQQSIYLIFQSKTRTFVRIIKLKGADGYVRQNN